MSIEANQGLINPQFVNRIEINLNCASTCLLQPSLEEDPVHKWLFPLSEEEKAQMYRFVDRTRKIIERAVETDNTVIIDAEQTFVQKFIDVVTEQFQYLYNYKRTQKPIVINTVQVE
jgi:hypothetical protein